jgi:hypothetical protein
MVEPTRETSTSVLECFPQIISVAGQTDGDGAYLEDGEELVDDEGLGHAIQCNCVKCWHDDGTYYAD